jgi:DNA repair protein RadD
MQLRQYQDKAISDIRHAFRRSRRVFLEMPTGAGKTIVFTEISRLSEQSGNNVWILVPRRELLEQASGKLSSAGVKHGIIAPGYEESTLFNVHVVSKDTLLRRLDSIKTKPRFIIVDEGHLAFDFYRNLLSIYPDAFYLFVTATPERLDGKPLNELAPALVRGPSMRQLIEQRYLAPMEIYSPPIEGLESVKRQGTEYNAIALDEFLAEKKIYGRAVEHYRRLADEKPCIVYCRNLSASKRIAERFTAAGYTFEPIDGSMAKGRRKAILDAVRDGTIDGVTSCELITYGVDVPRVGCISMLRPTMSRALYYQMIGRGLRFEEGKTLIVLDHVGNTRVHCQDRMPWERVEWNFFGSKQRTKNPTERENSIRFCPWNDFKACSKLSCLGCPYNQENKPVDDVQEIDGELVPVTRPIPIKQRPQIEQDYYQRKINECSKNAITGEIINSEKITELLTVAQETGRQPMWVYWHLCREWHIVCVPLLHEIRRLKGYKPGWVRYKTEEIRKRLDDRQLRTG